VLSDAAADWARSSAADLPALGLTPEGIRTVLAEHVGQDHPVEALKGPRED